MTIDIVIRTLISRFLLLLLFFVMLIPMGILICLPERVRYRSTILFWGIHYFYKVALWCTMMPISVIGKENLPDSPAIFVANHQSSLDIPLLGSLVGGHPYVWIARSELMDTWLLRFILPRVAQVIDVNSPKHAMRSMLALLKLLNGNKLHLMIFPEGGRYVDGKVHEFFAGFVTLAKKTECPVVPVYINGVNKIYPPGKFWINWGTISVVIGDRCVQQEHETDEAFKERVYDWFVQQQAKYSGK